MTPHLRTAALLSMAAGFLLLIFAAGWILGNRATDRQEKDLIATRTLMLELMRADGSHDRMRAATTSLELDEADPTTIHRLGRMLRRDESTNVRLAALDALQRFGDTPAARDEMLAALGENPPPAVQIQLMETLVQLGERRVLPYLRNIMKTDSLPRQLRDRAELGTFKLI
jgi:HEAT repeat protein